MKKLIITLTCLAMVLSLAACNGKTTTESSASDSSSSSDNSDTSQSAGFPSDTSAASNILSIMEDVEPTEKGDIEEYAIAILDSVQAEDSEGNAILVVSYEYTNNSDKAAIIIDTLSPLAIQDDEDLQMAPITSDNEHNLESMYEEAEPGETITVNIAYNLLSSSPVTVIVIGIPYDGETNITKTFELD